MTDLLTPAEVAARLRIKPRTVYDLLAPGGSLHHLRLEIGPKTIRVRAADFEDYLDEKAARNAAS